MLSGEGISAVNGGGEVNSRRYCGRSWRRTSAMKRGWAGCCLSAAGSCGVSRLGDRSRRDLGWLSHRRCNALIRSGAAVPHAPAYGQEEGITGSQWCSAGISESGGRCEISCLHRHQILEGHGEGELGGWMVQGLINMGGTTPGLPHPGPSLHSGAGIQGKEAPSGTEWR